jgi:hypothetical protein
LGWKASEKSVAASTVDDNSDAKNYLSSDSNVCTVDGFGNITFLKPGNCDITSTIIEGVRYNSAVSNSVTFTVEHEDRNLNLTTTATNNDTWGFTGRSASASAGDDDDSDAKTYVSSDINVCTVDSNGNLTLISPGTCSVTASIARGNRFKEKTSNSVSFEVAKKVHSLSGSDKTTSANSSSSSMSVASLATTNNGSFATTTYSVETGTNTAGCSVDSSGTATYTSAGECYVLASNAGNSFWATGSSRHKLTIGREARTLNASTDASDGLLWGTIGKSVVAVASADDTDGKTFSTLDPAICTVNSSGNLTLHKSGRCSVTATVVQGNKYNSAVSNTVSFNVAKKDHVLSGMEDKTVDDSDDSVFMNATVSSDTNTTRYAITGSNTAGCTVNNITGLVTYTKAGECEVIASNNGDERWNAATPLKKKLTVNSSSRNSPTPSPSQSNSSTPTPNPSPVATPAPSPVMPEPYASLPLPSPSDSAPLGGSSSINTVDVGNGVKPVESEGNYDLSEAERSITELASEKLAGFASGVVIRIDVIGARTAGQFVVAPGTSADSFAVAAALEESRVRLAANFAEITRASAVSKPDYRQVIGGGATQDAIDLFSASGLSEPITVGDLEINPNSKWLKFEVEVDTYQPGSVVYLAVTTQPVIFGAALVDNYGKASFFGLLPIDALEPGGHSVRIVGIRQLDGVSTDENGEIVVSDQTMTEIEQFDEGTKSTVKISGKNASGGSHLVIREIPILKIEPWWTVWLVLCAVLSVLFARRQRKIVAKLKRTTSQAIIGIATLPGLVLGWYSASYNIMGFVALISAVGAVGVLLMPVKLEKVGK